MLETVPVCKISFREDRGFPGAKALRLLAWDCVGLSWHVVIPVVTSAATREIFPILSRFGKERFLTPFEMTCNVSQFGCDEIGAKTPPA